MTGRTRSTGDIELVKVAYAHDEFAAEFLQGLLREADVGSVVRRAPGFDVPEFLAAGPRHVLVAASDVPVAQDVLRRRVCRIRAARCGLFRVPTDARTTVGRRGR